MKGLLALFILMFMLFRSAESGSACPSRKSSSSECFCSNREDGFTIVVCPGIYNTSHLEEATKPLKSLVVDRLLLLNAFSTYSATLEESENEIDPRGKSPAPSSGILPKKWLSELRVRDLEIQSGQFNGFFLTDDAFEGQADFLTSLVVKNANLKGHLCASCSPSYHSVSTKGLRRTPLLKHVDLSHNQLEVLDGSVFPSNLKELTRIVLADNQINRVNDNAFAGLHQLNHLDLSRNRLTAISRKIFRMPDDSALTTLDLSYNAIQTLPEAMFQGLNALRELKLSNNLLETLPMKTWTNLPSLMQKIDVRGNFLVCNCTMSWISRRLSKNTKLIGNCIGPKAVEYQDLKPNLPTLLTCRE